MVSKLAKILILLVGKVNESINMLRMHLLMDYKFCSAIFLVELIFSSTPAKKLNRGDFDPQKRGPIAVYILLP